MERFAWMGKIKPGMEKEYKRRHDEIWPEMKELLKKAGIANYTIWSDGVTLFGYYECEKGIEFAEKTQAGSPIVDNGMTICRTCLSWRWIRKRVHSPS